MTPDSYVLHRQDKAPYYGLAVFVKPNLPLVRLTDYEDSGHEFLAFAARLEGPTLLLFFIYRSPSAICEFFDAISDRIDSLITKYPSVEIAVFGDFNIHHTEWTKVTCLTCA